ncbi:MAG: hypothetical protein AMJ78_06880 [Omnitrophica WOR_2 bacterium SM23_29]|nr:MAG: hypothetical protein AMJ78_06880 [Omnitrophica WOR_2 bacterium SM23_29]
MKVPRILFIVMAINLCLNVYGNNWGLPSRLYADEKVTNVLHMLNKRTLVDVYDNYTHPTGYQLLLSFYMIPFFGYMKLVDYPVGAIREAASTSWMHLAKLFPDFAINVYTYARTLSALLGAFTVYLIFLLGKKIYNEKVGLFSAIFLSLTLGFVGVNHFAKYISFVNFLIVLSLLFCVRRSFYWAAFFSGLAASVQLNAFLLLLPLSLVLFLNHRNFKNFISAVIISSLFYAGGFIVGTPTILSNFSGYAPMFKSILFGNIPALSHQRLPFFVGPLNYFFELLTIYGIFIFAFIICGICLTLYHWKRITKDEAIVLVFVFAYYVIVTVLFEDKYPQTKHIIAIVPPLTLLGGKFFYAVFKNRLSNPIKYGFLLIALLYSFAYTFKGDLVLKKEDTRYISTKWIYAEIPKGAKIETFNQIHFICLDKVFDDYEFIYLGRNSKSFKGKNFFNWVEVENKEEYLDYINRYDSDADFIMISLDYMEELYLRDVSESHLPGLVQYMRDLFDGRKNFRLVKIFTSGNQRLASKRIDGFYYPESVLWNPVPSAGTVSPTIYVFEKIKKG